MGSAQKKRRPSVAAGAGVLVATAAILGAALLFAGTDDSDPPSRSQAAQTSPTSDGIPKGRSSSPSSPQAATPTRQELRDFARNYVLTAAADPRAGFEFLTAEYQAESPRYRDFWNAVSDAQIMRVSADVTAMTVTYTYRYRLRGNVARTEKVRLNLVQEDGQLLIAGAQTL